MERSVLDNYSCRQDNVEKRACVCAQGFWGDLCENRENAMCYLNITNPPLYETCSDRADTFEYMYSIPGFDPCHPIDFNDDNFKLKFETNCKFTLPNTKRYDNSDIKLGGDYEDLVEADEEDLLDLFNNRPDEYWRD